MSAVPPCQDQAVRIAVLADIHGDAVALEAVLRRLKAEGTPDLTIVLGDLAAIGADPVGVIRRVREQPGVIVIRGNTDRYVCSGERPGPRVEEAREDPGLVPQLLEVATSFAWTRGAITAAGQFEWLSRLPLDHRMTLPDGARLLAVHAAPGLDDGPGINASIGDAELERLATEAAADLILVGHTHQPFHRISQGREVLNPGSVGNPVSADLMAGCAMIECDECGHEVSLLRVAYDHGAAVGAVRAVHHPAGDFIVRHHEPG